MSATSKLAGFALVLALVFGAAALAGAAIDSDGGSQSSREPAPAHGEPAHETDGDAAAGQHPVRGLAVAEGGLRLVVDSAALPQDEVADVRFRIVDERGRTVDDFELSHEKRMHLIVARRDLTNFQHLHPRQAADGAWQSEIRMAAAGSYRMFADFKRDGRPSTLAADLRVDGRANLRALPAPAATADAGGGYRVDRAATDVRATESAELRFSIRHRGRPVRVEPYLGAGGHLVALREGDMAFLHVHPTDDGQRGDPRVGFEATFPTAGRYRLFLQFNHDGEVRTASFAQEVR